MPYGRIIFTIIPEGAFGASVIFHFSSRNLEMQIFRAYSELIKPASAFLQDWKFLYALHLRKCYLENEHGTSEISQ